MCNHSSGTFFDVKMVHFSLDKNNLMNKGIFYCLEIVLDPTYQYIFYPFYFSVLYNTRNEKLIDQQ
jgi:hypothetical protein